jgi:hypothetical protein
MFWIDRIMESMNPATTLCAQRRSIPLIPPILLSCQTRCGALLIVMRSLFH